MNKEHALYELSLDLCLLDGSYKQQLERICTLTTIQYIHYFNIAMQKTFGQDKQCPCHSKLKLNNLCWSNNTGRANACHLSSGSGINFQPKHPVEVISIPAMTPEITVVVTGKWLACFVPTESVFRSMVHHLLPGLWTLRAYPRDL